MKNLGECKDDDKDSAHSENIEYFDTPKVDNDFLFVSEDEIEEIHVYGLKKDLVSELSEEAKRSIESIKRNLVEEQKLKIEEVEVLSEQLTLLAHKDPNKLSEIEHNKDVRTSWFTGLKKWLSEYCMII